MTSGRPTIELSNGVKMPAVGLGTWQSTPEEVKLAVRTALVEGYRLIDTAEMYQNEEAIGEILKEAFQSGKLKREDVFITTKAWFHHLHPDRTEAGIRGSLARLGLDYVDLYLAHVPTAFNNEGTVQDHSVSVQDVWRGLEGVYEKKLTRAIGLSNVNESQVERVLRVATVPTFKKLNWKPAPSSLEDPEVKALATKYKKTPAQILLRLQLDRGLAVIPKSVTPARIHENFQLFDFKLTNEEVVRLLKATQRTRLFGQDFMAGHPEDAFVNDR